MITKLSITAITLLAVSCLGWTICDVEPRKKHIVTGTVNGLNISSGQFRPAGVTLYVRRINPGYVGIMPICDTIVSDSLGHFTTELYPGDYGLLEPWKLQPLVIPADSAGIRYDSTCIAEKYRECDYVLHVTGETKTEIDVFRQDASWFLCRKP